MRMSKAAMELIAVLNRNDLNCEQSDHGKRCWEMLAVSAKESFWYKILVSKALIYKRTKK